MVRADPPTVARPAQSAAVMRAAFVPGAPVTVTGVSGGTRSVCPGPATSAAPRLGQDTLNSTATEGDRAMYIRPQRSPSTSAGIDSSRACTTVCGEPTGWRWVWESLPPTASTRRPARSSRCQIRSDSSSSRFHRPFHTSSAFYWLCERPRDEKKLVEIRQGADPSDAEEPDGRAGPDPRDEPGEVLALGQRGSAPLGEPWERTR
jgi:hypothetical protein